MSAVPLDTAVLCSAIPQGPAATRQHLQDGVVSRGYSCTGFGGSESCSRAQGGCRCTGLLLATASAICFTVLSQCFHSAFALLSQCFHSAHVIVVPEHRLR